MYKLVMSAMLLLGITLILHPSRYLSAASQQPARATSGPVQERPSELVEKNERNRQESTAYTTDDRLRYTKGNSGKMTTEARRLDRDVTFLTEDSFTVLPQFPEPAAKELLSQSVLAIRGYINRRQAFLTDNDTAIFTEYEVSVSEVFKTESGVQRGDIVYVTRPGGALKYEGHILNDEHSRYLPIEAGQDCLLFLKEGNVKGTYSLYQAISIQGEKITGHVFGPANLDVSTAEEALSQIRSAMTGGDQK